jgi:predicted phage terminase large subunit-like protein
LGHSAFQAQYQQNPLPAGAGFFDLELIKRFENPPKAFEHKFFSVDVATVADGGDYSVCTIWGYVEQKFYLLDVWRKQVSLPELRKALIELDNKWAPSLIFVEAIGSGVALYQDLFNELGRYVVPCYHVRNKAHRFEAATLLMEKGRVWMPTSAPWLETLIKELQAFPQGKHDDQVDSLSQILFYWRRAVQLTRTISSPRARREVPTNYDVVATHRANVYSIGGMPWLMPDFGALQRDTTRIRSVSR